MQANKSFFSLVPFAAKGPFELNARLEPTGAPAALRPAVPRNEGQLKISEAVVR